MSKAGSAALAEVLAQMLNRERMAPGFWDQHWLGGRRRDSAQSVRPLAGKRLGYLAAHAVPDQDEHVEAECGDHRARIICQVTDRVPGRRCAGQSPAAIA